MSGDISNESRTNISLSPILAVSDKGSFIKVLYEIATAPSGVVVTFAAGVIACWAKVAIVRRRIERAAII